MRVLIASCIRQPTAILEAFLEGLEALEKPFDHNYYFIENGLDEEAHVILHEWAREWGATVEEDTNVHRYLCDEETHHWNYDLVSHVIEMKNRILDKAKAGGMITSSSLTAIRFFTQKLFDTSYPLMNP